LKENSTYTVLLVDKGNGLEPQVKQDSTGAGTVPVGGVDTGMGGTAGPDGLPVAAATGAVLLVGSTLLVRSVRRRVGG
jgi:hypothetical protein